MSILTALQVYQTAPRVKLPRRRPPKPASTTTSSSTVSSGYLTASSSSTSQADGALEVVATTKTKKEDGKLGEDKKAFTVNAFVTAALEQAFRSGFQVYI